MKTHEDRVKRTFGKRAATYTTSKAHADPVSLEKIRALASPKPEWTVLDIATGTGHLALALAPHVARVVGIDLTPEMLAEAEKLKAQYKMPHVEFRTGDVHGLPFDACSFDLVTCRRAPHHFSDIKKALQEIHRVLKPDRCVVIEDRSIPEDDFVDETMNKLDLLHDMSHVREYRPSEWRSLLLEAGFLVEMLELSAEHRPLTSLTMNVDARNVKKIKAIISKLTRQQKELMNIRDVNGQPYINHWFVQIKAKKA
ncbi:MAG: class I SAM-dependent methyltransferase [Candidatus Lokiarchaeota archaeon]|nr:class I SAM-dependent methyltransferase [Candidatus Lokiarchaeota archaeon]